MKAVTLYSLLALAIPLRAQLNPQGPKLSAANAVGAPQQGYAVALGNALFVGGPADNGNTGAVWPYEYGAGTWSNSGLKLSGSGAVGTAYQGSSIATNGATMVEGGYGDNNSTGAAWIFTQSENAWSQQGSKLVGTGAIGTSRQGWSVAVSQDGSTVAIGGPGDNGNAGAVWIFTQSGGVWTQQGSKLVGSGAQGAAFQGYSVALSSDGNTLIEGGYADNGSAGAAWIFTRAGGVWTQKGSKLVGTGAVGAARQGWSVALSQDATTALVGGPADNGNSGAVWAFSSLFGPWTQQGNKLVGNDASGPAQQGFSVAISAFDETLLVGGTGDNSNAGAAWVWTSSENLWFQQGSKLVGPNAAGAAQQGWSVAISSKNQAVLGGPADGSNAGAAWVFATPANLIPSLVNFSSLENGQPARFGITVDNGGGSPTPPGAAIVLKEILPAGFTATALDGGISWNCTLATLTCTYLGTSLDTGFSPQIDLTVQVPGCVSPTVTNNISITVGGAPAGPTGTEILNISTGISLLVTSSHAGNFSPGQPGVYTINVSNAQCGGPTSGTVTVTDTPPVGLTLVSMTGAGWNCSGATCTRADVLPLGASYPPITATFSAPAGADSGNNTVTLSGGGSFVSTATDFTVVQSNVTCVAATSVPPTVRADGVSELLGDLALTCTGGLPPTAGSVLPTANLTLQLGTQITSRLLNTSTTPNISEALLIIDDPGGPPNFGVAQTLCSSAALGAGPGGCVQYAAQEGSNLVASSSPTAITPPANIFAGLWNPASPNQVVFNNVPFLPGSTHTLRVTNVRANVAEIFGESVAEVRGSIGATASFPLAINSPSNTMAFAMASVAAALRNPANTANLTGHTLCAAESTLTPAAVLQFSEQFGIAWKTRVMAAANYNAQGEFTSGSTYAQNIPGVIENSESGFILNTPINGGTAGLVDFGTRLRATFRNVPAGVRLFVSVNNVASASTPASGVTTAVLVNEAALDGSSVASFPAIAATTTAGGLPLAELTVDDFATAEAAWEVTATNPAALETANFAVYLLIPTPTPSGFVMVDLGYSPILPLQAYPPLLIAWASASDSFPIPRFDDLSTPLNFFSLGACVPDLTVSETSSAANFAQGDAGDTYAVTVQNAGAAASSGPVTVVDTPSSGLTVTGMGGEGWSCTLATLTCSRGDALAPGSAYPAITVTVSLADQAAASVSNAATVSGGGETNTANDSASLSNPVIAQVTGSVAEFKLPTPNSGPSGLLAAPDGALWFTEGNAGKIGRITTAGSVTEFAIPTPGSSPSGITLGPDGALWFTEYNANQIGRITLTGSITEYPLPSPRRGPASIVGGPDGALWFTESYATNVGRMTTAGAVSEYAPPSYVQFVVAGPDGALWLTEFEGVVRLTTAGVFTEYTAGITLHPTGIAVGPDGALWFCEAAGTASAIGRMTTAGVVTNQYPIPNSETPEWIITGPDGALWFADFTNIGRITTSGVFTQYAVPQGGPGQLAVGSDNAIWFTDPYSGHIGRISLSGPPALSIDVTHTGIFTAGEAGATYTVTVSNAGQGSATAGPVRVAESIPAGLTLVNMSGPGWSCSANTCTRADSLSVGASYPPITVTVNVAGNAPPQVVNQASVSGGGSGGASGSDPTAVQPATCTFSLGSTVASLSQFGTASAGGVQPQVPLTVSITPTAGALCGSNFTAVSSAPWLSASGGAGSFSYTALTNPHPAPRSATLTLSNAAGGSAIFTVTEAGDPEPLLNRQVRALYQSVLGRDPDAAGFAFWTGSGSAGLGQMLDSFLTSPEAFNSDFAAMAAYQAATGAVPTYAQFTAAVAGVRAGGSIGDLFSSLISSNFTAQNLYDNLLSRAALSTEVDSATFGGLPAAFQSLIAFPSNITPVTAPNNEFMNTGTFQTAEDHSNGLYIAMLYYVILGRDFDPAGYAFWLGIATGGGDGILFLGLAGYPTRIQILGPGTPNQGFAGSPEFQGLYQ